MDSSDAEVTDGERAAFIERMKAGELRAGAPAAGPRGGKSVACAIGECLDRRGAPGAKFLKFGRSGRPSTRNVFLSEEGDTIVWESKRRGGAQYSA